MELQNITQIVNDIYWQLLTTETFHIHQIIKAFKFLSLFRNKSHQIRNKKVVYTIIFAGYDDLKEPEFVSPDFDSVCFTDDGTWNQMFGKSGR